MWKLLPAILIFWGILLVACSRRTLPVITERPREAEPAARSTTTVKPDTAFGRILFMNRCGRCHDLPQPGQFTAQRWEGILSYMIPRARLTEEQGLYVTAYLKANALN